MNPLDLPLRDIHAPPPPGWWPPAPGWWILAALIFIAVAAFWSWRRRRPGLSAADGARREIARLRSTAAQIGPLQLARELSVLVRRAAISFYPRTETASITGENWLRFLDRPLPDAPFTLGPGRLLAELPYRPDVSMEQAGPLLDLCARWIDAASANAGAKP
jgi:hypothetical protein